jgi:pyridoxal phosphate enzyme (YggS family)
MSITANLERIRNQLADVCARAGRDAASVKLMAVSKTHPAEAVLEAISAGQRLFGENRVQEFAGKAEAVAGKASFHLIGPLQSNKTRPAAELFDGVDSVDSLKVAQRLNAAAGALGKVLPVLIEVKLSHEESKHGVDAGQLSRLIESMQELHSLRVSGLMTVPPFADDPEAARPYFVRLRQLLEENQAACPTLVELSMGMSHDFPVAVAEGATVVRVGTAIFGRRTP